MGSASVLFICLIFSLTLQSFYAYKAGKYRTENEALKDALRGICKAKDVDLKLFTVEEE